MIGSFLLPGDVEFAARPRQAGTVLADRSGGGPRAEARSQSPQTGAEIERAHLFARRLLVRVETHAAEVAIVYRGDRVADVVGPAQRKLYWCARRAPRIERFAIDDSPTLDARTLAHIAAGRTHGEAVCVRVVPDGHEGLLFVAGELRATLPAGVHAFWCFGRTVHVELVDLRLQSVDVDEQALLTRDRVALRVNATVTYRLQPGARSTRTVRDARGLLCTEVRIQLRAAVGVHAFEALLTDGAACEDAATAAVAARLADFGIEVRRVGIREIVLPRELRRLLNDTYAVERQVLGLRIREIQAFERLAENVSSLAVYGGLDWLTHGAVRLKL